jgi:hypothetical protein
VPLDDAKVREVLADEFPERPIDHVWVADDGAGAVARSGAQALVLYRLGDGYVARQLTWTKALSAAPRDGRVTLELSDVAAPRAVLRLSAWPPKELVA